jgi:hypothetical protein
MSEPAHDPTPFVGFIADHRGGQTARELTDQLAKVTQAVRDTGKAGSVTLTLAIAPLKDATDILVVTDTVKGKVPELPRPKAVYFPDDHGGLHRDNPRQPGLFETARTLDEVGTRVLDPAERASGEATALAYLMRGVHW